MAAPYRLRVLVLATRVPLNSGDGSPSFVLDNAAALGQEFDISILAPRVPGAPNESAHEGVRVRRFAYFPRRWERLADDAIMPQLTQSPALWLQAIALVVAMTIAAIREQRRGRFNVVHAQWIIPSGLIANMLSRVFRLPYLITARGADVFRLEQRPIRWMKQRIINGSSRFIGVSNDIALHFDRLSVPVEVQPSGVDFALWEHLSGQRAPEPGKLLFVGRLATKKGVEYAIRAAATIEGARLAIIGDGPLRGDLKQLSEELDAGHRVDFLGSLTRSEIAQQMRTAACIVIPSVIADDGDCDGTPNVLGEAIAARVPVVGSRIAGIAEHLQEERTGLLFKPGDIDDLRKKLLKLLWNTDSGWMDEAARDELRSALDIRHVARRYSDWYRITAALEDSR